MKHRLAIIDGCRTPFGKSGGAFKAMDADDLGAVVVKELMARTDYPAASIDEVIFGNVAQPMHATNVARVIALKAGLPASTIAHTVQRNCGSGMQSITAAANAINAGEAEVIIAGGAESMTNIPLVCSRSMTDLFSRLFHAHTLTQKAKVLSRFRPSFLKPRIALQEGLTDPICGMIMGKTAEVLAEEFHVARHDQDSFALKSHQRAAQADENGVFAEEIVPVPKPPDYADVIEHDEGIRHQETMEQLERMKPFFIHDTGTVTVGNSSQISDGAAALLLMSEERAREEGLTPLGYLRDYAYAALDGCRMGLGPVHATARLFKKTGLTMQDMGLMEINEAFAAQVLACEKAFDSLEFAREHFGLSHPVGRIDMNLVNVNGGAIALGHPVGATGTRLVLSLLMEMRRRNINLGLAALCIGGGQGAALALEVT